MCVSGKKKINLFPSKKKFPNSHMRIFKFMLKERKNFFFSLIFGYKNFQHTKVKILLEHWKMLRDLLKCWSKAYLMLAQARVPAKKLTLIFISG